MSEEQSDALRIPLEIRTEDIKELQDIISDISKAQSEVRELRPLRGKTTGISRSPLASRSAGLGIYGAAAIQSEATPGQRARDVKSRTPFVRDTEFDKIKDRLDEVESGAESSKQFLGKVANTLGLGGIYQNTVKGNAGGVAKWVVSEAGVVSRGGGLMGMTSKGMGGILGGIGGLAGRAFLPVAIIMSILEIVSTTVSDMFKPGGIFDRRLKIDLRKEIASSISRQEKEDINRGLKVIRTEVHPGNRGQSGSYTSLSRVVSGQPLFNLNQDLYSKSLGII